MRMPMMAGLAIAALLAASSVAAETIHFSADIDGAQETPPHAVAGRGRAEITLDTDTKALSWRITYSGLTGPATMAHFHGPAGPGKSAGVAAPITGGLASPIVGQAQLDDGQIGDLRAGLWYVNIHTAKYPGGEIRGQIVQAH